MQKSYRFITYLILAMSLTVLSGINAFATTRVLAQDNVENTEQEYIPAWDGQSRFTVLVMGMDRRPNARDTLSTRTDVIILVSIDPINERIGILHIPRDLHFTPPGTGDFIRVNTLMIEGERLQEDYGPYYVMDTIQYNLSIYVDRYVAFDFEAFIALVDAMGGVEITTTYTINDPTYPDMNYGFDPFFLPSGRHILDGEKALKFVRTRHGDNDFVRGARQLDLMSAIHKQITRQETLPRLLLQAPQLFEDLRGKVYTDLNLEDMMQLARFAITIPEENVFTGSINQEFNMLYTLPGGTTAYIPDRTKLADLMTQVFGERYFE